MFIATPFLGFRNATVLESSVGNIGHTLPDSATHTLCGLPFSTSVTRSLRSARRSTNTVVGSGLDAPWTTKNHMDTAYMDHMDTAYRDQIDAYILLYVIITLPQSLCFTI